MLSTRISYCSFRKVAQLKWISAQLGELQPPAPPRALMPLAVDLLIHHWLIAEQEEPFNYLYIDQLRISNKMENATLTFNASL